MFFFFAFSEVLNKKLKILKTTVYFATLTCLFSFFPMISTDEEPMEVDGGPSSPPTANTVGGAQVRNLLTIHHIYSILYLKQRSNETIPQGK